MDLAIRTLTHDDLGAFRVLAANAGLAAAIDYMGDYLRWQPDGYLAGVDGDGRLVCTVGAQRYGPVAFIGAMCVDPALQRSGLGERILTALLERLRAQGVTTSLLEATAMGAGLYRKLGFVTEHQTGVFRRTHNTPLPPNGCPVTTEAMFEGLAAFDAERTGLARQRIITDMLRTTRSFALPGRGFIAASSTRIGPWIADDCAGELLDAALSLPFDAPPVLYAPLTGRASLVEERGFALMRTMDRMRLGPPVPSRTGSIHALATAGVG